MKITDRIRLLILFESITVALCVLLYILRVPMEMLCAAGLSGEGLCMIYLAVQILRPLKQIDKGLELLSDEETLSLEKLTEQAETAPTLGKIELLIRRYSDELMRQNTAQVFDKQTELTALQSQINPHFLYNTLEAIRGQALMDGHEEIARMTEALGAFFRYSISRKGTMVTLRDELANINNYMLIQTYRFDNRFSLEVVIDEADEEAYECMVPRLIIQPVVENAIFHGLEDMEENGKVTIEILLTQENLILMISDNGKGIPEEALRALNERIHSSERRLVEPQSDTHHTGIALPNIHRRIQLLYGEKYGVSIYSTEGLGTDVEILLPANT